MLHRVPLDRLLTRRSAPAYLLAGLALATAALAGPLAAIGDAGQTRSRHQHRAAHQRAKLHVHKHARKRAVRRGVWRATAAGATTATFVATADANTSSSSPTTNYGTNRTLRSDVSPVKTTFVRFIPSNVTSTVTSAKLRIFTKSSSSTGFEVHPVTDNTWDERSVTWATQPTAQADVLGNSGAFNSRRWVTIDVTGAVAASGPVTFAVVTPSTSEISLASREAGSGNAPSLVVTQDAAPTAPPPPATDTSPPSAPTALKATPGDGQVVLAWAASADDVGIHHYELRRDGVAVGSPTTTTYTDAGLVNGAVHTYSVVAYDAAGNRSAASASVTSAAVAPAVDTQAPSPPSGLSASAGNAQVALSWTAATDDVGVTGYRVYRNGSLAGSPAGTSYTDTGLTNGTSYSYAVKAIDAAGNLSAASGAASASPAAPAGGSSSAVPFMANSPWNTPIGASPTISSMSATYMKAISDNGLPLTSDPDQYTIPVYTFDDSTPRANVQLREGYWQSYDKGDDVRGAHGWEPLIPGVPIPPAATQSLGSDGQIIMWNPATGEEWEFWQWRQGQSSDPNGIDADTGRGNYTTDPGLHVATNATRYHTADWSGTYRYFGRFNGGGGGRGAGTPYLAGLVRPWEIAQGRIDHALAFAYNGPAPTFVYPATKTDGDGVSGVDAPEGTRIQLDPSITDAQLTAWGLSPMAKTIARALQAYGMYVIDNSGSSKIYLEDRLTAKWDASVTRNLVSGIPWSAFRVVTPPPVSS